MTPTPVPQSSHLGHIRDREAQERGLESRSIYTHSKVGSLSENPVQRN